MSTESPERPLLALVPQTDVWVVANFKEDQIGAMKPGQRAHRARHVRLARIPGARRQRRRRVGRALLAVAARQREPFTPVAQDMMQTFAAGASGRVVDPATGALVIMNARVSLQALVRAFNDTFTLLAIFFAFSILLVFLLKPPPKGLSAPAGH